MANKALKDKSRRKAGKMSIKQNCTGNAATADQAQRHDLLHVRFAV